MTDTTATRIDEQRLELLRRRLAERGPAATTTATDPASTELADGQRRMWFLQTLDRTSATLNVCLSYRITGPVDVDRLHRALDAVAVRHTALRTTYRADGDGEPRPVTDPG
ncbi:MAG TPA: condensation domain-containing protein, partial [Mycobacterium sp.]|nr:condensation domain-containing protein [Mycobacterium sp.]